MTLSKEIRPDIDTLKRVNEEDCGIGQKMSKLSTANNYEALAALNFF